MFDVVTIGDATFDTFIIIDDACGQCQVDTKKKLLCMNYADKICVKHLDQSVGGNAANIAVGCKKLGLQSAILTELGDDINGYTIAQDVEKAGVNIDGMKLLKGKDTRFSIVLNFQAERTILSYHAPRKYALPEIPQTKWLYYTSLGAGFQKVQAHVIRYLKKHPSKRLAMNPGSHQMNHGLAHIRKMLPYTNILFVNKEELAAIAGEKGSIKKNMQRMHEAGVGTVVVTDGTKGSYASNEKERLRMDIYSMDAIAKTGAGDAYASGFLSAHITEKPLSECMQWGTANATGVIQKIGAHRGLLSRSALKKMIEAHKTTVPRTY